MKAWSLVVLALSPLLAPPQDPGYADTPLLPGGRWRVHAAERPPPPAVTPGEGTAPPSDALVLFDGKSLDAWTGGPWTVENGALVVNGKGDLSTKERFGDCQLHLEWAAPSAVQGGSQERGNSGVFLMDRYEVQILDSFDNRTYADGQAGALYGQFPPQVNACRPPGAWQTYDIFFRAPRFAGDALESPAVVTVVHNGVLVQHARELLGATRHKELAVYAPHAPQEPLRLQDHGNPVRFRNIWIRRLPGQ
jgi:hypothetical protein